MINIQDAARNLHNRIYAENYYITKYEKALDKFGMDAERLLQNTYFSAELIQLASDFWNRLPDSPDIRTGPFFDLCDIAECELDRA